MSVGIPESNLPDGYVYDSGSSNWWIYPGGANAGAAIACHVPLAPNGIKFGGIGIVPDDNASTTIYFNCGLSTKNYGGRNTTFHSLDTSMCKAWVQVALPDLSNVQVDEYDNARFVIPTNKSDEGIAHKTRAQADAGLIVPITWSTTSDPQSQYTPVELNKSNLTDPLTGKLVKSIEWRPYMPKTVNDTDWTDGFCTFNTSSPSSTVGMGFSASDNEGRQGAGSNSSYYNLTMYPNGGGVGLYPSQTPAISMVSGAIPDMPGTGQNSQGVDIYNKIAMPLVGGDPNGTQTFNLSAMNGAWYLKKDASLSVSNYDQVKIGYLDASNNNISTLGGAYPIPVTENTLTVAYTRSGEPNQKTFSWEGKEELVELNSVGDVSNIIMDLSAGAIQKYFWGNAPPFKFGIGSKDGIYQVDSVSDTSNVSGLTTTFPVLDISFGCENILFDASLSVTSSPAMVRMDISSFLWSDTSPVTWLDASLNDASAATFMSVQQRPGDRPIPPTVNPSTQAPPAVSAGRDHSYYFGSPEDNYETELSHAYQYLIQGTSNEGPFPFTEAYPFFVKGSPSPTAYPYLSDVSYARFISWTPSAEGVAPTVDVSGKTIFINNGTAARQLVVDIPYGITDCSLAFGLRVKKP